GVQEINGSVTLTSPAGLPSADLTIDDSTDSGMPEAAAVLDATSLTGLAPTVIHFGQANLSALTIKGGTVGQAFQVTDTPSDDFEATVTTIDEFASHGGGTVDVTGSSDTLVIKGGILDHVGEGNLQNISGDVFVENSTPNPAIHLIVNDTVDPAGRMVTLDT